MELQGQNLSLKKQGDDVKLLQSELRQLGFTIADKELDSSFFGDSTFKAVQDFQGKQGLKKTGVVDKETAALINKAVDALSEKLKSPPATHKFVGQLFDQKTGAPLPGLKVEAFDLDADKGPKELGSTVADEKGIFIVVYATETNDKGTKERGLRLRILNAKDKEVHQLDLKVEIDEGQVFQVLVPPAEVEPPGLLTDLAKTNNLDLPQSLLAYLAKLGIQTLDDIRNAGGLSKLDGLPVAIDSPAVKALEAHARLTTLSSDLQINSFLIQKGYDSPAVIAKEPRSKFVTSVQEKLGTFEADQLQVMAQAQMQFLSNVLTDFASDFANGFLLDTNEPRIQSLFEARCQCTDCEAALSPLAYLVDLLDYALTHLTNADAPITLRFLTQNFHQPFGELQPPAGRRRSRSGRCGFVSKSCEVFSERDR